MNYFFILLISLILHKKYFLKKSNEFYECINPAKQVSNQFECNNIKIPDTDGYKCCSMEVTYKSDTKYSCFAIESEYARNIETLENYITTRSIDAFFESSGGQIVVNCGNLLFEKTFNKKGNNYLNCYKGHINMVNREDECINNDIPYEDGGRCCFMETDSQNYVTGLKTEDKRCFIINDKYFIDNKILNNFIKEESNIDNLDQIKNTNITIKCKNYETLSYNSIIERNYNSNNTNDIIIGNNNDIEIFTPTSNNTSSSEKKPGIGVIIIAITLPIIFVIFIVGIVILWLINKEILKKIEKENENNQIQHKDCDQKVTPESAYEKNEKTDKNFYTEKV